MDWIMQGVKLRVQLVEKKQNPCRQIADICQRKLNLCATANELDGLRNSKVFMQLNK